MDLYLSLPTINIKQLSFCKATPQSLEMWVEALPVADLNKTAQAIYLALGEIAELDVKPACKLQLLDVFDEVLGRCLTGLRTQFLNKPLMLEDQAATTANFCMALMKRHQSIYYWAVEMTLAAMNRKLGKPNKLFSKALAGFFNDSQRIFIQQSLLYRPCDSSFWQLNHQLYSYAQNANLFKKTASPACDTVQHHYAQLLLLGAMNSHQLRQRDMQLIEKELPHWAQSVLLSSASHSEGFLVDLDSDNPPLHESAFTQLSPGTVQGNLLYLCCQSLVEELTFLDANMQKQASTASQAITGNLCKHLILAWSANSDRTFMRLESDDEIDLCIGLHGAHFIISGQKKFDDLLFGNNIVKRNAAKQRALQLEDSIPQQGPLFNVAVEGSFEIAVDNIDFHLPKKLQDENARYRNFNVNIMNVSPGGYCLSWDKSSPPPSIRNNELIAIKEAHHPAWQLACIRWVKQQKQGMVVNMGVELLSPSPQAYGARWVNEKHETISSYFKAILLPEIKTMGQKASLIISESMPAKTRCIIIERDGQEQAFMLTESIQDNVSFQQFHFVESEILEDSVASGSIGELVQSSMKVSTLALQ